MNKEDDMWWNPEHSVGQASKPGWEGYKKSQAIIEEVKKTEVGWDMWRKEYMFHVDMRKFKESDRNKKEKGRKA